MAIVEEKADSASSEDTLHHRETLLVVTAGDLEDVALPFVTEGLGGDLIRDALVVEGADLPLDRKSVV